MAEKPRAPVAQAEWSVTSKPGELAEGRSRRRSRQQKGCRGRDDQVDGQGQPGVSGGIRCMQTVSLAEQSRKTTPKPFSRGRRRNEQGVFRVAGQGFHVVARGRQCCPPDQAAHFELIATAPILELVVLEACTAAQRRERQAPSSRVGDGRQGPAGTMATAAH